MDDVSEAADHEVEDDVGTCSQPTTDISVPNKSTVSSNPDSGMLVIFILPFIIIWMPSDEALF